MRYVPPRWIYEGTAICGVPSEVSRAMLRAWHAHNGVSLGSPRLGFVCTKQTTDGQPGLIMKGIAAVFDAWNALWEGAASVHNRRLVLTVTRRLDWGDPCFEWRIREKARRGSG